ncbi:MULTISPECIES: bacillithiol biosynthesis deacetylase BshB1 [Dyadobacter]|uniref:Bacillithiol biosynthesis deacetylase BshB1 n=1 Tax=Dyadobacter chenhuakuii TaxID=2909339 RepID=A0A9X1QD62_9BACT|nr:MULTISPECIES: bacillithiol biosynthesis deacetylase BshB1 [Dyadobacter]MCE7070732.1 bacillithiol biosynthesis deacetylase BshB1 [Dyadobacter sp. CY327]MCF2494350.1 bacillithiol biosynthesis deacetylase BshB1 [Dyadobacter chenhuakuii]MCF2498297.1 bacillithiol biosynthesis deacetylase BshB1 [Dyadobacter chenhuakuii]USJ31472.1 bacillithiol biosynthesis deacetylase BshB1 [Dyadobacter chenhuakuii]
MKLDILAITAHPDDVELCCAGTLLSQIALGKKVGIVDLTRGELGTRGTPEGRIQEAKNAAAIMNIAVRDNVGLADGFFANNEAHQKAIIPYIRKYQPDIVITNAVTDRHPDHGRAGQLVSDSCFYSGLRMVKTFDEQGNEQEAWRPRQVFHTVQDRYITPDFIVDITHVHDKKVEAIRAFESQFFVPSYNSDEPQSYISSPDFLEFVIARAREMGHAIGVTFGEGFTTSRKLGVRDLSAFI